MSCACQHHEAYDCWALRYGFPFDATHDDIRQDGGPCECSCHEQDDDEEWENDITPAMEAAYKFVESIKHKADASSGGAPLWHGWALRTAFLQGVQFGRDEINAEYEKERKG